MNRCFPTGLVLWIVEAPIAKLKPNYDGENNVWNYTLMNLQVSQLLGKTSLVSIKPQKVSVSMILYYLIFRNIIVINRTPN